MVQRTEVVRAAELRARQIVEAAENDVAAMRHEVEDFCDQRLGSFEIVLDKLTRTVHAGRERLNIGVREAARPRARPPRTMPASSTRTGRDPRRLPVARLRSAAS